MTEEVAAHLKEGGVAVKPYHAMLDNVRKAASSGMKLWTDPAKASSQPLLNVGPLNIGVHLTTGLISVIYIEEDAAICGLLVPIVAYEGTYMLPPRNTL